MILNVDDDDDDVSLMFGHGIMFLATFLVVVLTTSYYYYFWIERVKSFPRNKKLLLNNKKTASDYACPNPNCIRCQKYRQVQKSAKMKLSWIAKEIKEQYPNESLDRVEKSVSFPTNNSNNKWQGPSVLMVHDLPSKEVVTEWHMETSRCFQNSKVLPMILKELINYNDDSSLWCTNDSPKGSWKVLYFMNQGSWVFDVCKRYPKIFEFVQSLPNILDECLFGNIMISTIHPNTVIEPHCGPTNIRHRLQYALQIPKEQVNKKGQNSSFLSVGEKHLCWEKEGHLFVFDDSYLHSVTHHGSARTVLIIDVWHPNLTLAERQLIQSLYPPL